MTLEPESFARICRLVHERAAIVLEPGKEYLVESRLSAVALAHGFHDVDTLCRHLDARHPQLISEAVEAMTTNETSFYRDHHPFEALRSLVLPDLIEKRESCRRLRIWCAACSTGQEPYSLAIMLDRHFPRLASWQVHIFASDLSQAVLARAAAGRYNLAEIGRGLSDGLRMQYFRQHGAEWELRADIRKRVHFEPMNLIGAWPAMPRFDLLLLRNVLIYFDQDTKRQVFTKARSRLADDGYLMLGGSENTPADVLEFERLPVPQASLYRPV